MDDLDLPDAAAGAERAERLGVVAELGDALRDLTTTAISSEVDTEVLRQVAAETRRLAELLGERQRGPGEPSSVDDLRRGQRPFNLVVGVGHAFAPPMRIEIVDGVVVGTCTLDRRHEGPITYGHGGVSALICDQIMGYAVAHAGHPGVTGRLEVRYRAAVPLGEELRVEARLVDVLGVRSAVKATISLAAEPERPLVQAEGRFVALRREQAQRLFGAVADTRR